MKLRKQAVSIALAVSLAMSLMPGVPLVSASGAEVSAEELGGQSEVLAQPKAADETEDAVEITGMTIADTYYSVNGEFPMYVEYTYTTKEEISRPSLTLKVVNKNTNEEIAKSYNYGKSCFTNFKATGVENGKSYDLIFKVYYENELLKTVEKTVSFESKNVWASTGKYLPTGKQYFDFMLNIATQEIEDSIINDIEAIYLLDEQGNIAARTQKNSTLYVYRRSEDSRYEEIFESDPDNGFSYYSISMKAYCTRKLNAGEKLTLAYIVKGNAVPIKLENMEITMIDEPYIFKVSKMYDMRQKEQQDSGFAVDPEVAVAINLYGYNVNFSKLDFVLKEGDTIVGKPISYIVENSDWARYLIQWTDGKKYHLASSYTIEYSYPEKLVINDAVKKMKGVGVGPRDAAVWNPKTDSIDVYSESTPSGSVVDYEIVSYDREMVIASGTGIKVDNAHCMEINLPEIFETNSTYWVYITYKDSDKTEHCINNISVNVSANKAKQSEPEQITAGTLSCRGYFSDQKSFDFSAGLNCSDGSKLPVSCSAIISKDGVEKEIELLKKGEDSIVYSGTYTDSLEAGEYKLSFLINSKECVYYFYVADRENMPLSSQSNYADYVYLNFGAEEFAKEYCSEENQKKISLHITDAEDKNEMVYTLSAEDGFTIPDFTYTSVNLNFSQKMKEDLKDKYYYHVYVYYEDEIVKSIYSPSQSLYNYSRSSNYEVYKYSENDSWISISLVDDNGNLTFGNWYNGKSIYNCIKGSESIFPVTVKITNWYATIELVTSFTMQRAGTFTEENLNKLSDKKLYNVYVEGANGFSEKVAGGLPYIREMGCTGNKTR